MLRRAIAGFSAAIVSLLLFTTPAAAAASDECSVRVADHNFVDGSRVRVASNHAAVISVTAPTEKPRYKVELEVAGLRSTVGTGRGRNFGWRRSLDVRHAATFGVGSYKLRVTTFVNGSACVVTGRIDIKGRAPITTVAGSASAVAAVLGAVALLVSLARRGGRPLRTRHAFVVEDPLGQFVAVDTPGNYVAWVEVACDVGARTFVATKTTADDVREFLNHEATGARLQDIRAKCVRVRTATTGDAVVRRLRWRPRAFILTPLLGILGALGVLVSLQQSARVTLTPSNIAIAAAIGLVAGQLMPNLTRLLMTLGLNRRLKVAERGLEYEEQVESRYPPIDHLDELDTFVWTPTHTVPEGGEGLPAWTEADRSGEKAATLDPGLPVRVVDRRDGLAQVVCSNGWVGWTDAEPLKEIDA